MNSFFGPARMPRVISSWGGKPQIDIPLHKCFAYNMASMPSYRVHRLNDKQRQQFRWAPHTAGLSQLKPKEYESDCVIEAATPYAVWMALKDSNRPLDVGDVLETEDGLRIFKYIGFEEACWAEAEQTPPRAAGPVPPSPRDSAGVEA